MRAVRDPTDAQLNPGAQIRTYTTNHPSLDAVTGGLRPGTVETHFGYEGCGTSGHARDLAAALTRHGLVGYCTPHNVTTSMLRSVGGNDDVSFWTVVGGDDTCDVTQLVGIYYRMLDRELTAGVQRVALIIDEYRHKFALTGNGYDELALAFATGKLDAADPGVPAHTIDDQPSHRGDGPRVLDVEILIAVTVEGDRIVSTWLQSDTEMGINLEDHRRIVTRHRWNGTELQGVDPPTITDVPGDPHAHANPPDPRPDSQPDI